VTSEAGQHVLRQSGKKGTGKGGKKGAARDVSPGSSNELMDGDGCGRCDGKALKRGEMSRPLDYLPDTWVGTGKVVDLGHVVRT